MEKKVLTSQNKVWLIELAVLSFVSAFYLADGLWRLDVGGFSGLSWLIFGVLWLIFVVLLTWKMVIVGKGAIILDAEEIAMHDCAANVTDADKVEKVGTVVLKWGDIDCIEKRLIKTTTGEVYTVWNATIFGIGKLHPWRIASPFGNSGWAEINRYYKEYKSNNK